MEDLGIVGNVIVRQILEKQGVGLCTGFIWLKEATSDEFLLAQRRTHEIYKSHFCMKLVKRFNARCNSRAFVKSDSLFFMKLLHCGWEILKVFYSGFQGSDVTSSLSSAAVIHS